MSYLFILRICVAALVCFIFPVSIIKTGRHLSFTANFFLLLMIINMGAMVLLYNRGYIYYFSGILSLFFTGGYLVYRLNIKDNLLWKIVSITTMGITLVIGIFRLYSWRPFFIFLLIFFFIYYIFNLWIILKLPGRMPGAMVKILFIFSLFYTISFAYDNICILFFLPTPGFSLFALLIHIIITGGLLVFEENLFSFSPVAKRAGKRKLMTDNLYKKTVTTEKILLFQDRLIEVGLAATGIVHELKNIFLALSSALKFIKSSEDPGTIRECLDIIENGISRGKIFTEKILVKVSDDFRNKESLELGSSIAGLVKTLMANYRGKGIVIHTEIAEDLILFIRQTDLEHLIFNLIRNSVSALDKCDRDEKWIRIKAAKVNDKVVIDVSDNGPGIPGGIACSVFDPAVSGEGGTGIGLYLVDILVKRNGGIIHYIPQETGSLFRIVFSKIWTPEKHIPD